MGLAPYGEPVFVDQLRTLVEVTTRPYRLNKKYFGFLKERLMYTQRAQFSAGESATPARIRNPKVPMDVARALRSF